ncbi:unnamed protein product [Caenorhabditis auriculariae]|uniref:Kinesin-like protein n=1 Tax=Caenorhabditis auriculariae TaxID=2777116 RepID=A0A8S1H6L2_9PELO|nr:unnamed protein product [Caenorhabditis auriculariae]
MNNAALRINVGMHVEIKRSDGRIHGAVVSEIKAASGKYMVEWYEKGDTKGKEVTLDELVTINPTLFRQAAPTPTAPQPPVTTRSRASIMPNTAIMFPESEDDDFLLTSAAPVPQKPAPKKTVPKSSNPKQALNETIAIAAPPPASVPFRPLNSNGGAVDVASRTRQRSMSPVEAPPTTRATDALNGNSKRQSMQLPRPAANGASTLTSLSHVSSSPSVAQPAPSSKERPELRKPVSMPAIAELDQSHPHYAFSQMIREYRTQVDYRPLCMNDAVAENRISVCVRKRPLSKKEVTRGEIEVVTIPNKDHIILHQPQVKVDLTKYLENQKFRFDYTFDENSTNELVYRFTAQPLVKTIFEQGTATCFAYGQTGSGKTHTMGGDFTGKKQNASMGIYALTARDVFRLVSSDYRRQHLTVHCSFFEIYGAKVYDLLANKAVLRVLEDGKSQVQVVGLKVMDVDSEQMVLELINQGAAVRTAGTTSANSNSSRSHAVFQIILRQGKKQWGKFSLIDLAGNERGQDTRDCDRETRLEGAEINKSLLALKECIRAMSNNNSHVPFRSSKLTLVLRDSFVGDKARTVMISMISPGLSSCEHSLNTLRYANRVKELGADGTDERFSPMEDAAFMLAPEEFDYDDQETLVDMSSVEQTADDVISTIVDDLTKKGKDGRRLKELIAQGYVSQAIDGAVALVEEQMTSLQKAHEKLMSTRRALDGA